MRDLFMQAPLALIWNSNCLQLPAVSINTIEAFFSLHVNFFFFFLSSGLLLSLTHRRLNDFSVLCPAFSSHLPQNSSSTGSPPAREDLGRLIIRSLMKIQNCWAMSRQIAFVLHPTFWLCTSLGLQHVTNLSSYGFSTGKVISCVLIHWKFDISMFFDRARGLGFSFFPLESSNGIFCFDKNSEVLKLHLHAAKIALCFWRVHPAAKPQPALVPVLFRAWTLQS